MTIKKVKENSNWQTYALSLAVTILGGIVIWMFTNISTQNQSLSIILTKFENVSSSINRFDNFTDDQNKKISFITGSIDDIKSTIEILETARNKKVTRIFQSSSTISLGMVHSVVQDQLYSTTKKLDSIENILQTNSNAVDDFQASKRIMIVIPDVENIKPLTKNLFDSQMIVK